MRKLKIDYYAIATFVLFFCLANLPAYDYIGLSRVMNLLRMAASCVVLALYIIKRMVVQHKLSWIIVLICMMQFWILVCTVVNQGLVFTAAVNLVSIVGIAFAFEILKNRPVSLLKGLMRLCELLCYANLLLIVLFPNGLYRSSTYWQNWLLGYKNQFVPYFIVACLVAYIFRCQGGSRLREWGIYTVCMISSLLVESSTSIVGFFLLLLLIWIHRVFHTHYSAYFMTCVNAILVIAIPVLRLQEMFSFVIEVILGRDLSFTGRTDLWDKVLQIIQKNPILGYGIQETEEIMSVLGYRWAYHAHNLILDILLDGGFPLLIMYLMLIVLICRHLHRFEKTEVAQGAIIMLFAFQIMGLMEVYSSAFLYIIYFLAYYVKDFVSTFEVYGEEKRRRKRVRIKWGSYIGRGKYNA